MSTTGTADIGMVGMGVMGKALAQNFHSRGYEVAVYERKAENRAKFRATLGAEPGAKYVVCDSLQALAAALQQHTLGAFGKALDGLGLAADPVDVVEARSGQSRIEEWAVPEADVDNDRPLRRDGAVLDHGADGKGGEFRELGEDELGFLPPNDLEVVRGRHQDAARTMPSQAA